MLVRIYIYYSECGNLNIMQNLHNELKKARLDEKCSACIDRNDSNTINGKRTEIWRKFKIRVYE